MIYISVCSGIEAATAAWHHLGWEPAWFSEIEPFPCSVLKHHYPNVPNLGDMTKWSEWPDETIDLLVGGTPCQSFSVAGKRGGMDDHRGQLALSFSAIARRYRPRWIVWENVPGVLSSGGGRDFGAFLGSLVKLGYGLCYRVLDAQHFGVAQRRRRVFVVGHLGDWRRVAAVLFERESLCRDTAPSRKAGQGFTTFVAPSLTASNDPSRSPQSSEVTQQVAAVVGALACNTGPRGHDAGNFACNQAVDAGHVIPQQATRQWPAKTASTLYASFGSKLGLENQHINEGAPLFVLSSGQAGAEISCDRSPALTCLHEAPIVLMDQGGSVMNTLTDGTVGTLRREMHGHEPVVAFPTNMSTTQCANTEDVACNLQARNPTAVAVRTANTSANGHGVSVERAHTLDGAQGQAVASALQVRRLTPIECERLQGFPDGYTNVPHRGKPAADGPRYKALGNSMAVPCMRWIGERIQMVEAIKESEGGSQ